jgi:Zn-dependent alcohol dehydrogenase
MANLFTARQTSDNSGNAITTAYVGANYAVPTVGVDDFGTPTLSFLKIAGTKSASAVDISSAAFRAAVVRGVQIHAEMYGMGVTDSSSPYDVTVIVKDSTANGAEAASNVQATTFGAMEAAILAQVNAVTAATLDTVVVTRYAGFTGDILA